MQVSIIKTKEALENKEPWQSFIIKHFPPDFTSEGHDYTHWFESPFYFSNYSKDGKGQVVTYTSLILTTQQTYQKILEGKIEEYQIEPFPKGEMQRPYLYWPTLIVENKSHTPYLFRSIFSEVNKMCEKWELEISHLYNIAFSPATERLLKRYGFKKEGLYENRYPIMSVEIDKCPMLYARLPYRMP